jgi:SAM-dependent MidA family methyltransferase
MTNNLQILLAEKEKISFSEYMDIILFDKDIGFYESEELFGEKGHFVTSPLVSKHFSHSIGKHFIKLSVFENIIEVGAGDGSLAADLLIFLKSLDRLPKKYYFIERSKRLIKKQKSIIKKNSLEKYLDIYWVSDYMELPDTAFIISNELFDCFPTDIIKYKSNKYKKAYINNEYKIMWEDFSFDLENTAKDLNLPNNLPDNYIFEYSKQQNMFVSDISKVIKKACFLIFDYGYPAKELYLKDRMQGTVTCIKNHQSDFNPLADIGLKDISAFVNYTFLKNIFENNGWIAEAFMNQSNYLLSFDILDDVDINNVDEMNGIKKLIMPNHMGEVFKVLIVKKNIPETGEGIFIKNDIIKL